MRLVFALLACVFVGALPSSAVAYSDSSFLLNSRDSSMESGDKSISHEHVQKVPPPEWGAIRNQLIEKLTVFMSNKDDFREIKTAIADGEDVAGNDPGLPEFTEKLEEILDPFFTAYTKTTAVKTPNAVVAVVAISKLIMDRAGVNDDTEVNRVILVIWNWVSKNALEDSMDCHRLKKK